MAILDLFMQQSAITDISGEVAKSREHISDETVIQAIKMQSAIRNFASDFLRKAEYIEIPPVIISPLTDPLNHPVLDPKIRTYGGDFWLTKSMIFHKQIAVQTLKKIFIMSPNIRLELAEKQKTGRHLYEFTQIDVEALSHTREQMMSLAEDMIVSVIGRIKSDHSEGLRYFGRELPTFNRPFKQIAYLEAQREYGDDFEKTVSESSREPVWIIDIPLEAREFYDRENDHAPGILRDMDLLWPEGYEEAISGGEREYKLENILERVRRKGQTEDQFRWFIELARIGIEMSAGFGIGVERFARYVCGLDRIEKVTPFPKTPGKVSL
ncbi:MAG: asparagine synthetase A [Thermoplasmataceae archaeon]